MAVDTERQIFMETIRNKVYIGIFAAFVLLEIVSWFYISNKEYFFLLWIFINLIGVLMAFKREKWWLRFRPYRQRYRSYRLPGQYAKVPEVKQTPDVDYTTAEEQGMDVGAKMDADAKKETKEKDPFALPEKPKVVRLGMLVLLVLNITGLIVEMIYLY
jgi:hypothetical protein